MRMDWSFYVVLSLVACCLAACESEPEASDAAAQDSGASRPDAAVTRNPLYDLEEAEAVVPEACRAAAPTSPITWEVETLEESTSFAYGFGTGDVDASGAVFWAHYGGTDGLQLVMAQVDESDAIIALREPRTLTVDALGFVHHVESDLALCARYRYAWVEVDASGAVLRRSRWGQFRTPPPMDARFPVSFIMSGDTGASYRPFTLFDRAAEESEAEFFIFNGDLVYAHGVDTREGYHTFYRENWSDQHLQNALAQMSFFYIWDDHDVVVNWNGQNTPADHVAEARLAMQDFTGIRRNAAHPERLWRAFNWGSILDVIIVDSRSEFIADGPDRQYISRTQTDWLKERLRNSPALFKFIVISVPLGAWPIMDDERWSYFPEQRAEMLQWIHDEGISHVYWLSADHHAVILADVPEHGGYNFTGGPMGQEGTMQVGALPFIDDTVFYADGTRMNYLLLRANPLTDPPVVDLQAITDGGEILVEERFAAPAHSE